MAVGTGRFVETAGTDICGIPRLALQQRTASGWEAAPPLDSCAGSFNCCPACCQPESEVMPPLPLACSLPERASSVRVASVVIVFNPAGGSASASRRWDAVFRCAAALRAVGIAVRLVHTEFAGHATDIAQSLPLKAARVVEPSPRLPQGALLSPAKGSEDDSDDAAATRLADARLAFRSASTPSSVPPSDDVSGDVFDCIVVGGGDGTLREVVAGLVERADGAAKTVPVVALPIGTGNSTMLDMGVHEPMDAVSAVLGGRAHSVDAFELRHSGRAAGRGPGSDGVGSASAMTPHGPTVSKDIRDPETGVIIPPGRVVGVNVIGVLAPTDATLFAERNRWLGGLRYDVGGVGCLIALPKYDFHTHFSQQLLPVSGPLPTDSDLGISPAGSGECETALGSAPSPIGGSGSSSEPGSVGAEDTPSSACAATGSAALASPCAGADADGGESKERRCGPSSSESECGSVDSACSSTAAKRAGRLPDAGADKELFQVFWDDTLLRIRNVGVAELSVNKQLENVQKATFVDMLEYDAAIRQDDDNMELAAALFKGVFQGDESASVEDVIALADWTRNELLSIATQPAEDVYRGWITWSPALGETYEDRLQRQRRLFEGEWREEVQVDGRLTFWHTATREIRPADDVPLEGLTSRRCFALASHLQQLADEGKIDRSLVNPEGLRALSAVERGVPRTGVVIGGQDDDGDEPDALPEGGPARQ